MSQIFGPYALYIKQLKILNLYCAKPTRGHLIFEEVVHPLLSRITKPSAFHRRPFWTLWKSTLSSFSFLCLISFCLYAISLKSLLISLDGLWSKIYFILQNCFLGVHFSIIDMTHLGYKVRILTSYLRYRRVKIWCVSGRSSTLHSKITTPNSWKERTL